jgi:hypothetical protein
MEIYIPNEELEEVTKILAAEQVRFEVTDRTFALLAGGKKIADVKEIKAQLLETDVPVIYDQGPGITQRAFRLPSGKKFLITDAEGNFVRFVTPPAGWER